jgi:hypothetical protein
MIVEECPGGPLQEDPDAELEGGLGEMQSEVEQIVLLDHSLL